MYTNIYISSDEEDKDNVKGLSKYMKQLCNSHSIKVYSKEDINIGDNIPLKINKFIRLSKLIVCILSVDYLNNCKDEIEGIFEYDTNSEKIIIPVIISDCMIKGTKFQNYKALDFREYEDKDKGFDSFWNYTTEQIESIYKDRVISEDDIYQDELIPKAFAGTSIITDLPNTEEVMNKNKDNSNNLTIQNSEGFEKIIGRNGLTKIDWLSKGVQKSKSVCKIHTSDGFVGTGFLVKDGYIFTNNHVLESASIAQFSKIEFGYEADTDTSVLYNLDHTDFITSIELDYTRVKVKPNNIPLSRWGNLTINNTPPKSTDALIIVQHPQGRQKEIAFSDGNNSIWEHRLHYKVSTEPGSSGSPVFDIDWNVVALHHAGGNLRVNALGKTQYTNEGILFKSIQKDIKGNNINTKKKHTEMPNNSIKEVINKPIRTMLIYHPSDAKYAEDIEDHLYYPISNGDLELFDIHKDVNADEDRERVIEDKLQSSILILVLISKALYKRETRTLALNVESLVGKKRVVPIRVSPFDLNGTLFGKLQGLPSNKKAITDFENRDKVLVDISNSLKALITRILS